MILLFLSIIDECNRCEGCPLQRIKDNIQDQIHARGTSSCLGSDELRLGARSFGALCF